MHIACVCVCACGRGDSRCGDLNLFTKSHYGDLSSLWGGGGGGVTQHKPQSFTEEPRMSLRRWSRQDKRLTAEMDDVKEGRETENKADSALRARFFYILLNT